MFSSAAQTDSLYAQGLPEAVVHTASLCEYAPLGLGE